MNAKSGPIIKVSMAWESVWQEYLVSSSLRGKTQPVDFEQRESTHYMNIIPFIRLPWHLAWLTGRNIDIHWSSQVIVKHRHKKAILSWFLYARVGDQRNMGEMPMCQFQCQWKNVNEKSISILLFKFLPTCWFVVFRQKSGPYFYHISISTKCTKKAWEKSTKLGINHPRPKVSTVLIHILCRFNFSSL